MAFEYEVKAGDILVFKNLPAENDELWMQLFDLLQGYFDGPANHVEMVYDLTADKKVRTFASNFVGVGYCLRDFEANGENYAIMRLDQEVKTEDIQKAIRLYYLDLINAGKTKYDMKGLFVDAILNVALEYFTKGFWKKMRFLKKHKRYSEIYQTYVENDLKFCSELVAEILYKEYGFLFSRPMEENIDNNVITPTDIYRSDKGITMIKDFGIPIKIKMPKKK